MKKLIVANWKMTPGTAQEASRLFSAISKITGKVRDAKVVICPPFIWLPVLSGFKNRKIKLGAQDVFWENPSGSYTGEVSIAMLKNLGARYVIVGHSERRRLGETDEIINKKIKQALKNNLKVIFCVGELERDESGSYLRFVKEEIIKGLDKIPVKLFKNLIITYEPVWAISTGASSGKARYHADTPEDAFQMATYIKRLMVSLFGRQMSRIPILYGGSVDAQNAKEFLEKGNVDGLLVGRASWNVKSFEEILKNISHKSENQQKGRKPY